jgi:hypothetical protein
LFGTTRRLKVPCNAKDSVRAENAKRKRAVVDLAEECMLSNEGTSGTKPQYIVMLAAMAAVVRQLRD